MGTAASVFLQPRLANSGEDTSDSRRSLSLSRPAPGRRYASTSPSKYRRRLWPDIIDTSDNSIESRLSPSPQPPPSQPQERPPSDHLAHLISTSDALTDSIPPRFEVCRKSAHKTKRTTNLRGAPGSITRAKATPRTGTPRGVLEPLANRSEVLVAHGRAPPSTTRSTPRQSASGDSVDGHRFQRPWRISRLQRNEPAGQHHQPTRRPLRARIPL